MRIIRKTKAALILIIIILFTAAGCTYSQNSSNKRDVKSEINYSQGKAEKGTSVIDLSREELDRSGIVTERLKGTTYKAGLSVYGSVVPMGNLLDDFKNYETAVAQLAKSKADLSISQKNYERLKNLYEKKLASQQDYQISQGSYLSDKSTVSSAQANLIGIKSEIVEQWGNGISKIILNDSARLQNILSLKETLVQISLPPGEMNIKIPDKIFVLSPQNNKTIICRLISIGHLANLQFQTKTLYYATSNTSLSGGMNVKALLPEGKELKGVIVPSSSIVWNAGKAWAYVKVGGNKFNRVEIDTGNPVEAGFFVPLKNGILTSGNYVVTKGAQLLLSKELLPSQKNSLGDEDND